MQIKPLHIMIILLIISATGLWWTDRQVPEFLPLLIGAGVLSESFSLNEIRDFFRKDKTSNVEEIPF